MDPTAASDALSADPRLASLDRAPTPALLVGADGRIAWLNDAGRALGAGPQLDPASARAVASLGGSGLLRLRIGAAGRFEPLAFQGRRIDVDGRGSCVLLEALSAPSRRGWAPLRAASAAVAPPAAAAAAPVVTENPAVAGEAAEFDPAEPPVSDRSHTDLLESQLSAMPEMVDAVTSPDPESDVGALLLEDRPPDPRVGLTPPPHPEPETAVSTSTAESAAAAEEGAPPIDDALRTAAATRFVFEIDGDGRISFLSPDLAEAVGDSARGTLGRTWADVAGDLALDPSGAVAAAIAERNGWTGVTVRWPTQDGGRLPFALSAMPVFDRGRTFVGFRGLGSEITEPAVEEPRVDAADSEVVTASAPAEDLSPQTIEPEATEGASAPLEAVPDEAVPERHEPPVLAAAEAEPDGYVGNVVALRDAFPAAKPLDEPAPVLSVVEESAFDEIARRLKQAGEPLADAPSARDVWQDIAADAELALGSDGPGPLARLAAGAELATADDLRRLLDRIPLGMLVLKGGDLVYGNRAALEMSGHADVESLAARGVDTLFSEPLARDDAAPASLRLVAEDGVEVDVEARLSPMRWGDEAATAITLRRAEGATAALVAAHAREAELSAILDTATDGVLTLDGAGRILTINRSAEALFGYEAREIVGSLFSLALAPESRRVAYEYLDGLKSSSVASLLNDGREVLGLVRQGGAIPLYMTLGALGSGEDGRYCAVLRDITHWKKAEEELVAAKRQAERASAHKSDFLAKVSHEIRTPLNAIIGFAEVMMEERFGAVGNERYREYLKDIHLSGEHLISLVNDLLDLSKIESGKLELNFVDVDLNEAVAQAVALLQPQANRAHIIIRTSLTRSVPLVQADKRSIRQIVLNLASNAVKFTQGGGQVIVATALNDLGEPVIRVRDTGVGMSRKEIALALEPFRQLPMGGSDGAGLGLPLTKALTEANRAQFVIQSAVGEGTLVEVTFSSARAISGGAAIG